MKVLAVSQQDGQYPDCSESRDALDQNFISFLRVPGFITTALPNGLYKLSSESFFRARNTVHFVGYRQAAGHCPFRW